jgi:hypothetical protein
MYCNSDKRFQFLTFKTKQKCFYIRVDAGSVGAGAASHYTAPTLPKLCGFLFSAKSPFLKMLQKLQQIFKNVTRKKAWHAFMMKSIF